MVATRKPTKILELNGAFKKDPQRKAGRENELQVETLLGIPPAYFNDAQVKIWFEIVKSAPDGLFTGIDFAIVELAAVELERFRRGRCKGVDKTLLLNILSRMGFSPADRSKIQMVEKPKESKWSRHGK